ncbi:putative reverse transcriptase domain-containing protein [Tanacetum coccineum]
MTARISIRDEPSISLPPREEVERLLALTTPPPSPLTPLSSPLPHIPSPPFPASPPASPIRPLGYRPGMIWLRAETPSTSHPLPLPTSLPPLQLLSSDHKTDRPEITLPPRKRLGIDLGPRYEIGESSAAATTRPIGGRRADYGFVDPREAVEEVAPMTLKGVNDRVTELTAVQEQDTQDIYAVIEDTFDRQTRYIRAWGCSMEVSYMTRSEILALRSVVIGQQAVISQLQAADRKSQVVTLEMLQADYQRQVQLAEALKLLKGLQTQMLADCIDLLFCLATQYRSFVQAMINEGVTAALAARDATRNGDDSHTSGTGARRPVQVAHECTYPDFLKCQPLNFKGTEGVVGLTQWFEKMESIYSISNCTVACQTTTPEAAHAMPWRTLKKMMTDKYCPRGEIKKLEFEMNPLNVNTGANQRVYFECCAQGHFKRDCPKLKNNNNRGNRVRNAKAQAKVYAVGNAGANSDNNVITGMFLLNNSYASILFYISADRCFVSTAFSSQIVITPTALDHDYNVELADGRIVGLNTIIRGCTLNFLNHPFNIDLMPVELGSFDVIIGMDWLAKYHAVIICAEKIVRIPFGDEILIVRGDGSSNEHGTRLNIISCTKAQEYLTKGCHVFLANITATKDNSSIELI